LFLTNAPTYFKEVLKFDVQTDGFLSSIPYALLTFMNIVSGIVSDKLISSRRYTKNTVRKFFTIACNYV
jgi:sugar phosphate permease